MTNRAMITLPICLFLVVFASASSETITEVDPITEAPTKSPLKDGDPCDIDSFNKIACENDRLIFCSPTNRIASTPCNIKGRPGFCNCEKTACVAEKPNCGGEETVCLTPNTKLPDNLDCHKFSYCNENSRKVIMECPGYLVYDPNTQKCTDRNQARCAKVVCPKKNGTPRLIPFPHARNYYVLCYQGIGDVRKCPDKYYAVTNTMLLKNACQFDCKMIMKTGTFRDTNLENCRKGIFYVCKKSGRNFVTQEAKCPSGMYFDENLGFCTGTDTCE